MDPPVGGWRGALLPAFSVSPTAGVLLLVIDRARGGLAANWPPRKSAIWNHLRTAAADSLPAKGATANGHSILRQYAEVMRHQVRTTGLECYTRSHLVSCEPLRICSGCVSPASHRITGASSAVCRIH
ncbi:uncharacterized protein TrAFT101_003126 [Trichoderma asperellum]|uniref:uncharacterized protein n=1 Tax=Trichoderma asperellum TaxID=101201 RepID=UPI00331FD5C6|nr:hypothetical protein TrAFT101_003126 [Trichoderma asperellum]